MDQLSGQGAGAVQEKADARVAAMFGTAMRGAVVMPRWRQSVVLVRCHDALDGIESGWQRGLHHDRDRHDRAGEHEKKAGTAQRNVTAEATASPTHGTAEPAVAWCIPAAIALLSTVKTPVRLVAPVTVREPADG
jgi:hypothetical protein